MEQSAIFVDTSNIAVSAMHNKNTSWSMENYHFHGAFEIYYSLSDNIKLFVSDSLYNVNHGDLFVFNQTDLHRTVAPKNINYERYVIYFNPDFISSLSTPSTNLLDCFVNRKNNFSHCIHLTNSQSESLLYLFKKIEFYCSNNIYGADIYKKVALTEVLLFINSLYRTSTNFIVPTNDKDFNKIVPVIQYIHAHLAEELPLGRLAKEFYISKSYMCTLFKKATGFTINEYIVHRRILCAAELLNKDIPVAQVCEMVGFNNLSHFIRTFTNIMHISPKQYAMKKQNFS
jgi:AraC-like DNA-binding protein